MKKKRTTQSAFGNVCIFLGLLVFSAGILFALFAATGSQPFTYERTWYAPAGGVYEAWVARYNGTGNGNDEAKAVAVDNSGNVYVAGTMLGSGTLNDLATIKYDSAGNQLWVAIYNDFNNPDAQLSAMTIDGSGNVYVTGASGSITFTTIARPSSITQLGRNNGSPATTDSLAVMRRAQHLRWTVQATSMSRCP